MNLRLITMLGILPLSGCPTATTNDDIGGGSTDGLCRPQVADMSIAPAKCAAAKGLSGDIIGDLCLDMDKIDSQGLLALGFNLMSYRSNCEGWEIRANTLQLKNVNTAGGGIVTCGMSFPNIPIDARYSRITLSLIHQGTGYPMQQGRIELPDLNPLRLWISPAMTFDQRTIVEIDTAQIPAGTNTQANILFSANSGTPPPSWTISSIAVLGQTAQ